MPTGPSDHRPLTNRDLESFFAPQPLLPRTDAEFEERYKHLKFVCWRWAKDHFSQSDQGSSSIKPITDLLALSKESPELMQIARFVSCPDKGKGWEHVFNERRAPLVYAVLGKVLEVHVFGHEMFGAAEPQLKTLRTLDLILAYDDGFARQSRRASTTSSFLPTPTSLPPLFLPHLQALTRSVICLLSPLLPTTPSDPDRPYTPTLPHLLLLACKLSLDLRRAKDTVYYFTPAPFKNTVLEPEEVHALNAKTLNNEKAKAFRKREYGEKWVRIGCWPNLTAYRLGVALRTGKDTRRGVDEEEEGEEDEVRIVTRLIGRAEAVCEFAPPSLPGTLPPSLKRHLKELEDAQESSPSDPSPAPGSVGRKLAVGALAGLSTAALWLNARGLVGGRGREGDV